MVVVILDLQRFQEIWVKNVLPADIFCLWYGRLPHPRFVGRPLAVPVHGHGLYCHPALPRITWSHCREKALPPDASRPRHRVLSCV